MAKKEEEKEEKTFENINKIKKIKCKNESLIRGNTVGEKRERKIVAKFLVILVKSKCY